VPISKSDRNATTINKTRSVPVKSQILLNETFFVYKATVLINTLLD